MTLVLPDGLGDLVFGSCAAAELAAAPAEVAWLRAYASEAAWAAGEALLAEAPVQASEPTPSANTGGAASLAYPVPEALVADLEGGALDHLWSKADAIFLAPWIFGLYAHDGPLLALARRWQRQFWALSEYGRGMGPLHAYSAGLGSRLPTGWTAEGAGAGVPFTGGVFKTILRTPRSGTDWRQHFALRLGLWGTPARRRPRLWWAYGRRDSAQTHAFRLATPTPGAPWPEVVKIIPISADGGLATGRAKTTGELLAEQAHGLLRNPQHQVDLGVASASETTAHIAGQLSELLVHILTRELPQEEMGDAEVIVAPNAGVQRWAGTTIVRVGALELVDPSGAKQQIVPGRPVFMVAEPVPRAEMRTFLEQCESAVLATGDQSVAEAVLLGKVPLARPDAKVAQWEHAVRALMAGTVGEVPDLGESLRRLLWSPAVRARVAESSRARSTEVQARAAAEFGAAWGPAQETMLRAGMLG